jgi:hypothetical protein
MNHTMVDECYLVKILSRCMLSVFVVLLVEPCTDIDCIDADAYLDDRPIIGYRGVRICFYQTEHAIRVISMC